MGTLKQLGIANAVKEQVNQNKENQQLLAQATGPSSVHTWTKICTQNLNNRSPLK
jgi:hypothetical protein